MKTKVSVISRTIVKATALSAIALAVGISVAWAATWGTGDPAILDSAAQITGHTSLQGGAAIAGDANIGRVITSKVTNGNALALTANRMNLTLANAGVESTNADIVLQTTRDILFKTDTASTASIKNDGTAEFYGDVEVDGLVDSAGDVKLGTTNTTGGKLQFGSTDDANIAADSTSGDVSITSTNGDVIINLGS